MEHADLPTLGSLLLAAHLTSGRQGEPDPALVKIYWGDLKAYPVEAVEAAFTAHRRHPEKSRFFPAPGELLAHILGSTASRAAEAWAKVRKAISSCGTSPSICFDDPIIHLVLPKMGGYAWLSRQESDELKWKGKEFADHYGPLALSARLPVHDAYIRGEDEIEALRAGKPNLVKRPRLLGDAAAAQQVLATGQRLLGVAAVQGGVPIDAVLPTRRPAPAGVTHVA